MARLLLVDDERDLRTLYAEELGDEGYEVKTAGTRAEAMELLDLFQFDLLILDIQLDKESGLDLLQQLASQKRDVPVILCSAFGSYRDDFTSWLADSYVVKSSDFSDLKNEVRQVLARRAH